jgi:serine/threonine protein kinase
MDDSVGPGRLLEDGTWQRFVEPDFTPPLHLPEDGWPATPSNIDGPIDETVIGSANEESWAVLMGAVQRPEESEDMATVHPPGAFAGVYEADATRGMHASLETSGDEDTMAGVAVNSGRADKRSFEMLRHNAAGATGSRSAFPLRRMIARGGYGEVWEAVQVSLGRHVAVKHLRPDVLQQARMASPSLVDQLEKAFENEALTAAMLEHPNIVPVYDLNTDSEGNARLAMKLVRGETWQVMIQKDFDSEVSVGAFLAKHVPILLSISQAVAFAHSRGVVHRDLKPSQVMVGEFGEVLLMDWGIAAIFDSEVASRTVAGFLPDQILSAMTGPAGTPAYMAPEQTLKNQSGVGPWTDIYLLGGILYHLLCGRAPHGATTGKEAFKQACKGTIEAPSMVMRGSREIPTFLESLALQCLSIQPSSRPRSVKQVIRHLEEYLSGASLRREAEEIRAEILQRLPKLRGDYEELARLDGMAIKARALAPDHRHIIDTHEMLLDRYVQEALRHGDVRLARQQALRLENPAERERLIGLVSQQEERNLGVRRQHRAALLAVAGMTLTLLTLGATATYERLETERERAAAEFVRISDQGIEAVRRQFTAKVQALETIAAFVRVHPSVTQQEFHGFVASLESSLGRRSTLVLAEQVDEAQRSDFERVLRAEGALAPVIRERRLGRFDIQAPPRSHYLVGRFAHPENRLEELVGLDLLSYQPLRNALTRTIQTGQVSVTPQMNFPDLLIPRVGFIVTVAQPTQNQTDAQTPQPKAQIVMGLWNLQEELQEILSSVRSLVQVRVLDITHGSELGPVLLAEASNGDFPQDPKDLSVYRSPLLLGNVRWQVELISPRLISDREVLAGVLKEVLWPVLAVLLVVVAVLLSRLRLRRLIFFSQE